MKQLPLFLITLFCSTYSFASDNLAPLLNKVNLQLHAEQWVTTQTALVNVSINAAVTTNGIEKIQAEVMQKLAQLSNKGPWHLVSFDRQQDKTGLETIQIMAQARLPQADLGGLRDRAKAITKPGETFTIDSVQFTPSEEEFTRANSALRNTLYQQAKTEIDILNKNYPDQKYYLHQITFNSGSPAPMPIAQAASMNMMKMSEVASSPLTVGNKAEMFASVVLASMPEQVTQQLAQH